MKTGWSFDPKISEGLNLEDNNRVAALKESNSGPLFTKCARATTGCDTGQFYFEVLIEELEDVPGNSLVLRACSLTL